MLSDDLRFFSREEQTKITLSTLKKKDISNLAALSAFSLDELRQSFIDTFQDRLSPATKIKSTAPWQTLGFTLIELVMVITVISILAIIVIPKYFDLTTDSRIAAVKGLAASVLEGSTTAASQCTITPGCFVTGMTWLLTIGPGHYQMWNGYPDAGDTLGANEIDTLISVSDQFSVSLSPPDTTLWQLTNAPIPANCAVQYKEATSSTIPPVITVLTSGC